MREPRTRASRTGAGVRGGVEYRAASERFVSDKQYPPALFVVVNGALVLLFLAIVAALLFAFTPLSRFVTLYGERREVVYTVELYDYSGTLSSPDLVGTEILDTTGETRLGELFSLEEWVEIKEVVPWQEGLDRVPDGTVTEVITSPVRVVTLTLRVTAIYRAGEGYFLENGTRLAAGESLAIWVGNTLGVGTVTGIDLFEEVLP